MDIKQHLPWIGRMAKKQISSLPPGAISLDELMQAGLIGLWQAQSRFKGGTRRQFFALATLRIKGAFVDELREMNSIPDRAQRAKTRLENERGLLANELGREPTEKEMIDSIGEKLVEKSGLSVVALDDVYAESLPADEQSDPLHLAQISEMGERLRLAISELPERERLAVELYYFQDKDLKEIGEMVGCTEANVSYRLKAAREKLKNSPYLSIGDLL